MSRGSYVKYSVLFDGACVFTGSLSNCRMVYDGIKRVIGSCFSFEGHSLILCFSDF